MYKQKNLRLILITALTVVSFNLFQKPALAQQTKMLEQAKDSLETVKIGNTSVQTETAQANYTQDVRFIPTPQRADNTVIQEMAQYITTPRRSQEAKISLKDDFELNPETFFEEYKEAFGLGEHDEMRLVEITGPQEKSTPRHNIELKGYKFKQYYKNVPVINKKYHISYKERGPRKVFGYIAENIDLDVVPNISEQEALQVVMDSLKADAYCWLDGSGCPTPKADLKILVENNEAKLIYRFSSISINKHVSAKKPSMGAYINAHTGEIIILRGRIAY